MRSNLTVSYELILLMGWLLTKEKTKLRRLVKSAVENGFVQELEKFTVEDDNKMTEQLHAMILEFMLFLEEALIENLENIEFDSISQEKLAPALKKIDFQNFDIDTVWTSIQQAKNQMLKKHKKAAQETIIHPAPTSAQSDPQEMLFNLLLKNWDPEKKEQIN